jgi:uncharacterized protein
MSPAEIFDQPGDPVVDAYATEAERTYAMWTHLAGLIGGVAAALSAGISLPFALLAVLILWLIRRETSPFIDDHGREAVNFQISLVIYALILVPAAAMITCGLGLILIIPIAILAVVGTAMAASAASKGAYFRYPATIRLV